MKRLMTFLLLLVGGFGRASGQTCTNLHPFVGPPQDGGNPQACLVQGIDGSFYGTTSYQSCDGCGTVFRISGDGGSYTNLYFFRSHPYDGFSPRAGLIQGSDGNFYGTTVNGGSHDMENGGIGTVFRISPSGNETNLYSFAGSPEDGGKPVAGLVQDSDGNFYGTTEAGGASTNCLFGCGTVFRISPTGSETTLYSFASSPDGANPQAGLVQGSDGNFYGTTSVSGIFGGGTIFRISPSGSYTSLYSFAGGGHPVAGLVQGSDGSFYGTTYYGGTNTDVYPNGCGTVFRISPTGSETTLYSFASSPDGAFPEGGLVQGSDGNFYGTTWEGGSSTNCTYGCGTVFRISSNGNYTSLHSFIVTDGARPEAGLVQGNDGCFYGTTFFGGANNNGIVFKLIVPLSPPANQISAVQANGNDMYLSIPSVAGETYQLQFSNSMQPTNWSNVSGAFVSNSIGALMTLTNFGGAVGSQGFYRFDITP